MLDLIFYNVYVKGNRITLITKFFMDGYNRAKRIDSISKQVEMYNLGVEYSLMG